MRARTRVPRAKLSVPGRRKTSGSVSADGLSQSVSLDVKSYAEDIEGKTKKLQSSLLGIRTMVI